MKRICIFLLILLTFYSLHGCSSQDTMTSVEPEKEGVHLPSESIGKSMLSEDEITWFNTEYFNSGDSINMRNMMLCSQYHVIADIDLFQLFYNGIPGIEQQISSEERADLTEYNEANIDLDIIKITHTQINEFLQEYAGVNLEDTNQNGLDQFIYLEEYDAYYLIHSDINYFHCNIISGTRNEDDTITLKYEMNNERAAVTMKENENGYQFISNIVE